MSKTTLQAFEDLGIAIDNFKKEIRPYLESALTKLTRFIDKFWPGLSKEKDD